MSTPNGLPPATQPADHQEAILFQDVLQYWQDQVLALHNQNALLQGQLKNRERLIEELRSRDGVVSREP